MRDVIISTESGSDVPEDLIRKYGIYVVPMHVIVGGISYDDDLVNVDRVFNYYETTGKVPSTSCVNTYEYISFFKKLQADHPGCVIFHFTYSSNASGTWAAAKMAVEQGCFKDLYIIDTKTCTGGCTAYLVEAEHLLRKRAGTEPGQNKITQSGKAAADTVHSAQEVFLPDETDFDSLAEELRSIADHIECEFIPDTLEYLRAGGRVSNAKYIAASILQMKPLIEINREGTLVATKRYRGDMRKIVEKFLPDFINRFDLKKDVLYLMYGKGLPDKVLGRMAEIASEYGFLSHIYVMTGCVISCHGGKGAIGLAGVTK